MEENESEVPRLSPPKKTKFRGSILKKKLINSNDSSLDSTINEKPERKSRRVSFAAQTQIRVFQKEARHKSIGGSVASLRKKDHRKKTADIKAKATSLISDVDIIVPLVDRVNTPKHRFSIASNRDAETVSMDSFSHNVKSAIGKINRKKSSQEKDPIDTTTQLNTTPTLFNTVTNSPVRRSPRLRSIGDVPHQPSTELCDFLLQPSTKNAVIDSSVTPDDTTMHVDISSILNRLDNNSPDLSISYENQVMAHPIMTPTNVSHIIELSPPKETKSTNRQISQSNDDLINNQQCVTNLPVASPVEVVEAVEDWSMNLSNNVNSSLQTHNLISPESSLEQAEPIKNPIDSLFEGSPIHITPQKNPVFYQVDSTESSYLVDAELSATKIDHKEINNTDKDDMSLSYKLISIFGDDKGDSPSIIDEKAVRENADEVYETFLNKSNWFLDKISEINMDYTAKLIHSGSFNESNNLNYRNNSGEFRLEFNYDNTLFDDSHQITNNNVTDMDISSDISCTKGIEQFANDAKNTFFALNSLLNPNRTLNSALDSTDLNNTDNNYQCTPMLHRNFLESPPSVVRYQSASSTTTTFILPAILGDDLFNTIMNTIKTIHRNLTHSNLRLSENMNSNQTKMIQPLHDRNTQAEYDNNELAKKINELFASLSVQKKTMGQLQLDEKFLRSSLEKTKLELDVYNCELDRKLLIETIETDLFCSSMNLKYDNSSTNNCLNMFNLLRLYFSCDILRHAATIIINDFHISPFLNPTHSPCIKFLLALLYLHQDFLRRNFNGRCSMEDFSQKIKDITFKFYRIYASFNQLYEYHCTKFPMQFNFCDQLQDDVQLSFKVYGGNYLFCGITLSFVLNSSLECIVDSYSVIDLFQLYDCKNKLIEPLKQILDGVLFKPLFSYVNNLFCSIDNISINFRRYASLKYSKLMTDAIPKYNN